MSLKFAAKSMIGELKALSNKRHDNLSAQVLNRTPPSPEIAPITQMVESLSNTGQFEAAVNAVSGLVNKHLYNNDGKHLYLHLSISLSNINSNLTIEQGLARLTMIRDWYHRAPHCPYAMFTYADALLEVGWLYRGTGWANSVSEGQANKLQEYSSAGRDVLNRAFNRFGGHWLWRFSVLFYSLIDSPSIEQIFTRFEQTRDAMPLSVIPYRTTANLLLPRWFGDFKILEQFAQNSALHTQATAGQGFYAYVNHFIMDYEDDLDLHLDRDRFAQGVKDWLAFRPNSYMQTVFISRAYGMGMYDLCQDLLESATELHESANEFNQSFEVINSVCREFTGR